jgi:hypothetical protein
MLRPLAILAALAVLLLAASPARAQRPHDAVSLEYLPSRAVAAQCPGADYLHDQVRLRLGYDLFQADAKAHLTVKIDRQKGQYHVTGDMRDAADRVLLSETFSDQECASAVLSMAIVVAIEFTHAPLPCPVCLQPAPCPTPPPPVPAPAPAAPAPPPAAPPSPSPRPLVQIGAGSFLALASTPSPTAGFAVSLGLRFLTDPGLSIGLEGRGLVPLPSTVRDAAGASAQVRSSLISFAAVPCLHVRVFLGCGLAELGRHQFSASANLEPETLDPLHIGVGLRAGAEIPFAGHFAVRGYADLVSTLTNTTLIVHHHTVWVTPPLSGAAAFALLASF